MPATRPHRSRSHNAHPNPNADADSDPAPIPGDEGNTRAGEHVCRDNPHIDRHGAFSTMVNFHALQLAMGMLGGAVVSKP